MLLLRDAIDDMGGTFRARLRSIETRRRTTHAMGSELEAVSRTAVLAARFDAAVLERLHEPAFLAISRYPENLIGQRSYAIYEVVDIRPFHYQLQGLTPAVPLPIREELLERVSASWLSSDETWLEVGAVETGYRMEVNPEGVVTFKRAHSIPLQGSEAYLLTPHAVEEMLCVGGGIKVGELKGFGVNLRVDPESLVKYHVGVFGFTGVGKSNLTASLVRELYKVFPDLRIVVFDVSGEYLVHLADLVEETGAFLYTTEDIDSPEDLKNSQVVPDTLAERVGDSWLHELSRELVEQGRIKRLWLEQKYSLTLGELYEMMSDVTRERRSGSMQAYRAYNRLISFFAEAGVPSNMPLEGVVKVPRYASVLREVMEEIARSTSDRSSIHGLAEGVLELTREGEGTRIKLHGETPESMAEGMLSPGGSRLVLSYLPEPDMARLVVARNLRRLLYLKKRKGIRTPILVVLDEAQEFIPRDARGTAQESNSAVEAVLRQGRKYRLYAWISTQRVAYLNTNALQQLHSYFVSTLPRLYDRMVIADAFSMDYTILDKTAGLQTGEWLFVSYKATRQKNIPAFIKAEDNERRVIAWTSSPWRYRAHGTSPRST